MHVFRIGFIACFAAAVLGCSGSRSDPRASVTGTITYKGQPVKAGTVFFYHDQGGTYQAELKPDGYYQFMDVPTGDVKVVVKTEAFNPEQKPLSYTQQQKQVAKGYGKGLSEYDARYGKGGGENQGGAPAAAGLSKEQKEALAQVYVKLPAKYTSEKTTPLTYTVERGRQVKDFDLSD
jgi:hypothetical protein